MASHNRSVGEQVKSGFVIAGELVGGFLVFVLATFGLAGLVASPSEARPVDYLVRSPALIIATGIMFATAERWGGFIPGFLLVTGFLKGIRATILPPNGMSRAQAALVVVFSIAAITLLWRFIPPRRLPATTLDRAALTTFALSVATFLLLIQSSATAAIAILLIGFGLLLVAWAAYLWRRLRGGAAQQPVAPADGRRVRG